ncbi:hypothetical protein SAMN04515620_11358 [Collimonas sp. OK607]|uniref:hypothetical protein n=1 Tax=Collimonas sp. OK607 TaxID=1798194 RepID=UPI0008E3FEB6|nr:hypothetical protein [Collimonas sp. OK607]SFB02875.1 hypothetical protein SAMN04515620_11358 [Collimonas sp. OK607]
MKIPAQPYRCPLGRLHPLSINLDAIKQNGWQQQRILVVSETDDRLDFVERDFIRRLGQRLYGTTSGGGRHE